MGKSKTPKYRIEATCISFVNKCREIHSFAYSGKATDSAAKLWRSGMNASFSTSNSHLNNIHSPYGTTRIINQRTGECVAMYNPPMFEVV